MDPKVHRGIENALAGRTCVPGEVLREDDDATTQDEQELLRLVNLEKYVLRAERMRENGGYHRSIFEEG